MHKYVLQTPWALKNHRSARNSSFYIMATAATQTAPGHNFGQGVEARVQSNKPAKHDVATELYYYKDPGDGSEPAPTYVG